jgi:hypothetical protein
MAAPQTRAQFIDYCLDNKYSKWYFSLIEKAETRNWSKKTANCYVEGHHIIPKSIFKNVDIVYLTPREHFICHLLLTKMLDDFFPKLKMYNAFTAMRSGNANRYINSRFFETLKINNSLKGHKRTDETRRLMSEKRKKLLKEDHKLYENIVKHLEKIRPDMSGENNPMFGKKGLINPNYGKPKSQEHKENIQKALLGKKYTEERKENMSKNCPKNSLGKKWYHNKLTKQEKYFVAGQQTENFILGRLKDV